MSSEWFKALVSRLPEAWQLELKHHHYRRLIRQNEFTPDEPEDAILDKLVVPGHWVIDIGANIGHYTKRFSDLVGLGGRVIAIEPVPATFSLLSRNVSCFRHSNVTLLNFAASDSCGEVNFHVPRLGSGLKNYYMARIVESAGELRILALPIDSLRISHPISLIKIDVEGHELAVLTGMSELIRRDHPVLIVETHSEEVINLLEGLGYSWSRLERSPNVLFTLGR